MCHRFIIYVLILNYLVPFGCVITWTGAVVHLSNLFVWLCVGGLLTVTAHRLCSQAEALRGPLISIMLSKYYCCNKSLFWLPFSYSIVSLTRRASTRIIYPFNTTAGRIFVGGWRRMKGFRQFFKVKTTSCVGKGSKLAIRILQLQHMTLHDHLFKWSS